MFESHSHTYYYVILALITMSFSHLMRESFIKDFRVKLENDKMNQTEIDKMNQTEIDKTNQTKIDKTNQTGNDKTNQTKNVFEKKMNKT